MADTSTTSNPETPTGGWTAPPAAFGAAFAAVTTEALSWTPERCAELAERYAVALDSIGCGDYDYVTDTVYMAMLDAGLAEYDCDLEEYEVPAGWVDKVTDTTGIPGVGQVAWAVLARDRGLISAEDFSTLTGWWVAAGLPMPEATPVPASAR